MKNLHKKIIAGALIGSVLIGGFLSGRSQAFADSFDELSGPIDILKEEEDLSHRYMGLVSEYFNFRISSYKENSDVPAKKFFKNGGEFVQHLFDYGMKKGSVVYWWIGGKYYVIEFNDDVKRVDLWNQWNGDLPRFYDYYYEYIK